MKSHLKFTRLGGLVIGALLTLSTHLIAANDMKMDGAIVKNSISIGKQSSAAANALLDLQSTTKGILLPRHTTTQKNNVSSPVEGLFLYDSTLDVLGIYNGSGWMSVMDTSTAQTATNKTFTAPEINGANLNFGTASNTNRLLLPTDTTTNLDALTDSAGLFGYDSTQSAPVYNDGTGWKRISGGGGGSSGINILGSYNPGAEDGTANWSETGGGTLTVTSTAANVGNGAQAFSFDASANNDYVSSTARAIPAGLYGQNCVLDFYYKGFDSNITAQVHDGTNVVTSQVLNAASNYQRQKITFICPSSGNLEVRFLASADAAIGYWDEVHLGSSSNISEASQATFVGSIKYTGASNCIWNAGNTGGALTDFPADTDCATPSVEGSVTAPATKVPRAPVAQLGPGTYMVVMNGGFSYESSTAAAATYDVKIYDGTNSFGSLVYSVGTTSGDDQFTPHYLIGYVTYTTAQTNIEFRPRAASTSNSNDPLISNGGSNTEFSISIYKFPSRTETVISSSAVPYFIDANISGANFDLGGSDQGTYITPNNSSMTLTQNSGSSSVGISCSSTNENSVGATSCSAGSEEPGVVIEIPRAGLMEACFEFGHAISTNASGVASVTFQLIHTPNNAQTTTFAGKSKVVSGASTSISGVRNPVNVCGTFNFSSSGKKTIRLQYTQETTATVSTNLILADAASGNDGGRDMHVTARYIDQVDSSLRYIGQVSSNTAGMERVERAKISISGASACSITDQSGTWLSGASAASSVCSLTMSGFSAEPTCVGTVEDGTGLDQFSLVNATSSTAISTSIWDVSGNARTTGVMSLICMGPR